MAEENKEEKVDSFIERYHQGFDTLREFGCDPNRQRLHIKIPNARELLWAGLRYYLGDRAVWLPAYDEVAAWLTDNQRRGLLCIGGNGLGKSIICQRIIPALILKRVDYVVSCYTAVEMTQQFDILLRLPLLTVFFPSLLFPKNSALVESGKRESSAFSKNCQENRAIFLKNFFNFFLRIPLPKKTNSLRKEDSQCRRPR